MYRSFNSIILMRAVGFRRAVDATREQQQAWRAWWLRAVAPSEKVQPQVRILYQRIFATRVDIRAANLLGTRTTSVSLKPSCAALLLSRGAPAHSTHLD